MVPVELHASADVNRPRLVGHPFALASSSACVQQSPPAVTFHVLFKAYGGFPCVPRNSYRYCFLQVLAQRRQRLVRPPRPPLRLGRTNQDNYIVTQTGFQEVPVVITDGWTASAAMIELN